MSELVIISKADLEKMLRSILGLMTTRQTLPAPEGSIDDSQTDERLNQKQAAEFLGITQATLIRWKKKGLVPVEQLQGSTKVYYYKSQLKRTIQRNPKLLQAVRK